MIALYCVVFVVEVVDDFDFGAFLQSSVT